METFDLIQAYIIANFDSEEYRVEGYSVNGSIIKVKTSYQCDWDKDYRPRETFEIKMLEYITFVFNQLSK